jgi:hypothetical protein
MREFVYFIVFLKRFILLKILASPTFLFPTVVESGFEKGRDSIRLWEIW